MRYTGIVKPLLRFRSSRLLCTRSVARDLLYIVVRLFPLLQDNIYIYIHILEISRVLSILTYLFALSVSITAKLALVRLCHSSNHWDPHYPTELFALLVWWLVWRTWFAQRPGQSVRRRDVRRVRNNAAFPSYGTRKSWECSPLLVEGKYLIKMDIFSAGPD